MYIMQHPTYTLRIEIQDIPENTITLGSTRGLHYSDPKTGMTGVDSVIEDVKRVMEESGIPNVHVTFEKFEMRGAID